MMYIRFFIILFCLFSFKSNEILQDGIYTKECVFDDYKELILISNDSIFYKVFSNSLESSFYGVWLQKGKLINAKMINKLNKNDFHEVVFEFKQGKLRNLSKTTFYFGLPDSLEQKFYNCVNGYYNFNVK